MLSLVWANVDKHSSKKIFKSYRKIKITPIVECVTKHDHCIYNYLNPFNSKYAHYLSTIRHKRVHQKHRLFVFLLGASYMEKGSEIEFSSLAEEI